jgi:hypothetical protein
MTTTELVQDQSTNNLHLRGANREDGTPTALCNRRYRVHTYGAESQANLLREWDSWNRCDRCLAKAVKAAHALDA